MAFYQLLNEGTKREQEQLFAIPALHGALAGEITLEAYVAFLTQAYHHVKHTVPLLMSAGAALPEPYQWLGESISHYVSEEIGHHEWVLQDLAACGADPEAVRAGEPDFPCELMVAYAYDVVRRSNPLGIFGMVHVLEGTSARTATHAAGIIQERLQLPETAFSYLLTHGDLDQDHVEFLRSLMDRIDDPDDQAWIIHCARNFFRLYGDIFRGLPLDSEESER